MFRRLFSLALLILAAPSLASATSHFTVQNDSIDSISIQVYDGDDSVCYDQAKTVHIDGHSSQSVSCTGGGKQRCKIYTTDTKADDQACAVSSSLWSNCGGTNVIIISDGATLVIQDNPLYCSVEN